MSNKVRYTWEATYRLFLLSNIRTNLSKNHADSQQHRNDEFSLRTASERWCNAKSNFNCVQGVRQIFPSLIPIIRTLTPTHLQLSPKTQFSHTDKDHLKVQHVWAWRQCKPAGWGNSWIAGVHPPGFPSIQTFQEPLISFLSALHWDYFVPDLARHLQYTAWSQLWRWGVESLGVYGVLTQSCGAMGVGAMKPTIERYMDVVIWFPGNSGGSRWWLNITMVSEVFQRLYW